MQNQSNSDKPPRRSRRDQSPPTEVVCATRTQTRGLGVRTTSQMNVEHRRSETDRRHHPYHHQHRRHNDSYHHYNSHKSHHYKSSYIRESDGRRSTDYSSRRHREHRHASRDRDYDRHRRHRYSSPAHYRRHKSSNRNRYRRYEHNENRRSRHHSSDRSRRKSRDSPRSSRSPSFSDTKLHIDEEPEAKEPESPKAKKPKVPSVNSPPSASSSVGSPPTVQSVTTSPSSNPSSNTTKIRKRPPVLSPKYKIVPCPWKFGDVEEDPTLVAPRAQSVPSLDRELEKLIKRGLVPLHKIQALTQPKAEAKWNNTLKMFPHISLSSKNLPKITMREKEMLHKVFQSNCPEGSRDRRDIADKLGIAMYKVSNFHTRWRQTHKLACQKKTGKRQMLPRITAEQKSQYRQVRRRIDVNMGTSAMREVIRAERLPDLRKEQMDYQWRKKD